MSRAWLAEFDSPDALVAAARRAREQGLAVETYSPFPIDALMALHAHERSGIAAACLVGAVIGGVGGYLMQWYSAVIDRPVPIAGRPLHSWPMFVPAAFELAVLGAALFAFVALLVSLRLPDLRQRAFDFPDFAWASRNRFFLVAGSADDGSDASGPSDAHDAHDAGPALAWLADASVAKLREVDA